MIVHFILAALFSAGSVAQTGTKIGISGGSAGGSYYDVPSKHKLDKYGSERLSPTGYAFMGTLESDKVGSVYLRSLSVARQEDKTKLGKQNLFLYQSPKLSLKQGDDWKLFLDGRVVHYSQHDHFMYFEVNDQYVPDIKKNLELEEHARVTQHQTYAGPEVGACYAKSAVWKGFDFNGFLEATLAPVAVSNYKTRVKENTSGADLSGLNKVGTILAAGGQIAFEGIAKYKEKYYLKVRIQQSHFVGMSSEQNYASNRIGHYEAGYFINKNLSANIQAENNELLLHNKDRHAIDVYNIVAVGLNYQIPTKKKK